MGLLSVVNGDHSCNCLVFEKIRFLCGPTRFWRQTDKQIDSIIIIIEKSSLRNMDVGIASPHL